MPKHHIKLILLLCLFFGMNIAIANEFADISTQHEFSMRTRYQSVSDNWLSDAQAFTTRIDFTSTFSLDETEQWQFIIQPSYVYAFNDGDYNSVAIKKDTSPIPEPQGFNLNKMHVVYASDADWQLTLGRQPLSFDNERFIGAIEFWQTPQSFNAIKFDFNDQINWHFQYAYTNKVHRIFGQDSTLTIPKDDIRYGIRERRPVNELGEHQLNAHFFNLEYKTDNNLSLVAYDYLIENETQALFSTHTFGLRIRDEFKPNKIKYRYTAEFSLQKNAYNNSRDYQAWYSLFEASVQYKSHVFQLSQEIISEDNHQGFVTPLGTNHKFQGWADVFTGYAMQTGLRDQYFTYRGRFNKLRWRAVIHQFRGFTNSNVIGNEFDLELAYRPTRKWELKLIYADYQSKNGLASFLKANHDLSTWLVSVAYNL